MSDLEKILTLSLLKGVGIKKIVQILEKNNNSLSEVAKDKEFLCRIAVNQTKFSEWQSTVVQNQVAQEIEEIQKRNIRVVNFKEQNYPTLLKEIYDFPPLLFYYGELPSSKHFFVSFVGSRRASSYGMQQTRRIITEIAKNYEDFVVVSGLAYGIDAIAHRTALDLGVKTIAVLGSGLAQIYPKVHLSLAREIVQKKGAILSEFRTMTTPVPQNFPIRNRIISGLSSATVVMEAAQKSGALITAKMALEQNREIFVLPGNVDATSYCGSNQLLKQGANIITSGNDILEYFALQKIIPTLEKEKTSLERTLTKEEELIFTIIQKQPATIEEITIGSKLSAAKVMQLVTTLELQEAIRVEMGGKYYAIG